MRTEHFTLILYCFTLLLHAFVCELNKGCHKHCNLVVFSDIELAYKDQSNLPFLIDLMT